MATPRSPLNDMFAQLMMNAKIDVQPGTVVNSSTVDNRSLVVGGTTNSQQPTSYVLGGVTSVQKDPVVATGGESQVENHVTLDADQAKALMGSLDFGSMFGTP